MKSLRAERDALRRSPAGVSIPALSTGGGDPVELLEQADALRDGADKLGREIEQIDARIRELREERELDRRMRETSSEAAFLDENDPRLRVAAPAGANRLLGTGLNANAPASFDAKTGNPPDRSAGGAPPPSSPQMGTSGLPVGPPPVPGTGDTVPAGGLTNGPSDPRLQFPSASRVSATQAASREPYPRATDGLDPKAPPPGSGSAFPPVTARPAPNTIDENASLEDLERRRQAVRRQSQDLLNRATELEHQAKTSK
jgi:hypothetical protein